MPNRKQYWHDYHQRNKVRRNAADKLRRLARKGFLKRRLAPRPYVPRGSIRSRFTRDEYLLIEKLRRVLPGKMKEARQVVLSERASHQLPPPDKGGQSLD